MKRNLPLKACLRAHMSMPSKLIAWLSHLNRMKCYENGACLAQMVLAGWKSPWKMKLEDENRQKRRFYKVFKTRREVWVCRRALVADAERYPGKQVNLLLMFVNEPIITHQSILNISGPRWIEWRSANANLESPLTGLKNKKRTWNLYTKAKRHKRQSKWKCTREKKKLCVL